MWKAAGLLVLSSAVSLTLACEGPAGPPGQQGIVGPAGPEGEQGPGYQAKPSISAVTPGHLVQGREVEVQIAGFATRWTEGGTPSVSFGPGTTVKSVLPSSDSGLVVLVEAALDALPGRRNVTVVSNNETLVFLGGFLIRPAMEVAAAPAQIGRPGLGAIDVVKHDAELVLSEDPADYGFELPDGVSAGLERAAKGSARFWVGVDKEAQTGTHEVVIRIFPGETRERTLVTVIHVEDGGLQQFGPGGNPTAAPALGSVAGTFTVETLSMVTLGVEESSGKAPALYVLGEAGTFDEVLAGPENETFVAIPEVTYHVVAWEQAGVETFFTLTLDAEPTSPNVTDAEGNESPATAQIIPMLPSTVSGNFPSSADSDWFKVSLPPSAVGKSLYAAHTAGGADVSVEVYAANGTTSMGQSPNLWSGNSWAGPQITQAGTHYFRFFTPSWTGAYTVTLDLQ